MASRPAGWTSWSGDGAERHLEEHSLEACKEHRPAGRRVPNSPLTRRVASCLAWRPPTLKGRRAGGSVPVRSMNRRCCATTQGPQGDYRPGALALPEAGTFLGPEFPRFLEGPVGLDGQARHQAMPTQASGRHRSDLSKHLASAATFHWIRTPSAACLARSAHGRRRPAIRQAFDQPDFSSPMPAKPGRKVYRAAPPRWAPSWPSLMGTPLAQNVWPTCPSPASPHQAAQHEPDRSA